MFDSRTKNDRLFLQIAALNNDAVTTKVLSDKPHEQDRNETATTQESAVNITQSTFVFATPATPLRPQSHGPLTVVVSCPHTASLTNTAPFRPVDNINIFDVFAHCEKLREAGKIRIAYDREGTTTASNRDTGLIWSLDDPRLNGKPLHEKWLAVKDSVRESAWFKDSFQSQIKATLKQIVQEVPVSVLNRLQSVCLNYLLKLTFLLLHVLLLRFGVTTSLD